MSLKITMVEISFKMEFHSACYIVFLFNWRWRCMHSTPQQTEFVGLFNGWLFGSSVNQLVDLSVGNKVTFEFLGDFFH